MTYHQFVNEVEMKVKSCVADNISVQIHVAIKNNSCERRGIMMAEKGINISPTIYLEDYYKEFLQGESMEQIARQILNRYEEVRFRESWEGSFIQSFDKVKSRIVYKVINRERNERLLREVPHRDVMDLAMVCYVLIRLQNGQTATMLIKQEHLRLWRVTEKEVFEEAEKNVKRILPAKLSRMKDVLASMLEISVEEDDSEDLMYVMSNEEGSFGAACIFYEGVMDMIHDTIRENYYVIPSSVHEMIILPESAAPQKKEIEETVSEINRTQVEDEEVLSDRVYYYNARSKQLMM